MSLINSFPVYGEGGICGANDGRGTYGAAIRPVTVQ
ncbi:hypothetical protein J2X24_000473 [Asticcacaulis solisilvae]|nr:hypothetical protein [Asticcacaulis solisilvae]MDR6798974.1 hypothetical protein [Asticcacaulis sp. BE141]